MTVTPPPTTGLRSLCGGAIHLPGDPGYDDARMPWNVAVDQRPAAVAYPGSAEEVADVVRSARAAGLRVAAQGTGHNAGPLGPLDDVVLLRTSAMTGVTVDAERQIARAEAGALWEEVVDAVAPHGLMALHGSSPDVGVVGYSLGGGMGWYARELGLQANSLTAVELVTPDGEITRADADTNPDLFWALRGGGGNFGVVTAVEMRVYPIPTAYAGWLVYDGSRAEEVLTRWAAWAVDAPDAVTTSFRVLNVPPIEEMPPPFRGRLITVIDGAVLGDDETAAEILAPLRELGPEMDTFERQPAAALARLHQDPEGPTPGVSGSAMLAGLTAEAISTFVALGPGPDSPLLLSELRQLGGAMGRPHDGGGAVSNLEGQFALFAVAIAATPEIGAAAHAAAQRLVAAMAPWANGRQYLNFAENPVDAAAGYDAETYARLQAIRAEVDPDGLMVANHRIAGASPVTVPAQAATSASTPADIPHQR